jgi:hypothetical protein
MKKFDWFNLVLACAGTLLLAGCRGLSTKDERDARRDLATVTEAYHPDEQHRVLPELDSHSGI